MGQIAYGFLSTLLHSLWQSALLLIMYLFVTAVIKGQTPLIRRNYLYLVLLVQFFVSATTFCIYYLDTEMFFPLLSPFNFTSLVTINTSLKALVPWIFYSYLLIILCKSLSLIYHWKHFKSHSKNTWLKPLVELKLFTILKAHELGIRQTVTIWYSNTIKSPVTFGYLKPIILLPVALLNQLSLKEAESLIIHELTHIRNNDYLLNFILIISETVYFFNPFVKIIAARIKLEREKQCDVQVLQFNYPALSYAETLLKAARLHPGNSSFQLAAVSRNKQLLNRILFFTSEKNLNFRKKHPTSVIYLLLLIIISFNIIAITEFNKGYRKLNFPYTSTIIPGYNADMIYSLFTDKVIDVATTQETVVKRIVNKSREHVFRTPIKKSPSLLIIPTADVLNIPDEINDLNYVMPVSENESVDVKEMIVNEENLSSGKKITKAYKMVFINGQWMAYPLWRFTEQKLNRDSIELANDTTARAFHIIQ